MIRYLGIFLMLLAVGACAGLDRHLEEIVYSDGKIQKYTYLDDLYGNTAKGQEQKKVFFDALEMLKGKESVLPKLEDLPVPNPELVKSKKTKAYTGVIRNFTNVDLTLPSDNSSATLVVPARGYLEYVSWSPSFQLTAYCQGQPYCRQTIRVAPKRYAFLSKSYDFLVDIKPDKPKAAPKQKKSLKKRRPPCELKELPKLYLSQEERLSLPRNS